MGTFCDPYCTCISVQLCALVINLYCITVCRSLRIVNSESFRSNAFARRNRPHVERNDKFACVYLRSFACVRLHSFASTVRDRPRAHTCVRTRARTYIGKVWAWHYLRELYIHAYASLDRLFA